MALSDFFKPSRKYFPSSTDFDHLYGEYRALDQTKIDQADKDKLDKINERRHSQMTQPDERLSWDDIYAFELILLNYLPFEGLRNKAVSLRAKYLNIFGQDKFKTYLETAPLDPTQATDTPADIEKLKADVRYLLDQIYLALAALYSRDGLGKWLTISAAYMIILAVLISILLLVFTYDGIPLLGHKLQGTPLIVAFFAGAMGGLISILQRLQTIPSDGDPVYTLATFWHGAYALFVSPLTGAIFGVLLYLLVAGGVLQGRFFPSIFTPESAEPVAESDEAPDAPCNNTRSPSPSPSPSPAATPSPKATPSSGASPTLSPSQSSSPSPSQTSSPARVAQISDGITIAPIRASMVQATPSPTPGPSPSPSQRPVGSPSQRPTPSPSLSPSASPSPVESKTASNSATPAASPSASPSATPKGSTSFRRFLRCSGPATGIDYALLIIWCFIAGFAERLVPDTLNRIVDDSDKTTVKKV